MSGSKKKYNGTNMLDAPSSLALEDNRLVRLGDELADESGDNTPRRRLRGVPAATARARKIAR